MVLINGESYPLLEGFMVVNKILSDNMPIIGFSYESHKELKWELVEIDVVMKFEDSDDLTNLTLDQLKPLFISHDDLANTELTKAISEYSPDFFVSWLMTFNMTPIYELLRCFGISTEYANVATIDYLERFVKSGESFDSNVLRYLPEDKECENVIVKWARIRGYVELVFKTEPKLPIVFNKK